MPSVTIDAGVLVTPPEYGSTDDAHRYIETLLEWRKLLDEPWVTIYMSERSSDALVCDGLYPFHPNLKKLFSVNGIVEYDVNTVNRVVETLLQQRGSSFETHFKVRDVLTEDLSIEPDILRLSAGDELQLDLARCLTLIAMLRHYCRESIHAHTLILRHAPRQVATVRAIIHEIEHDRDDLGALPTYPEVFDGDVLICDDFKGLIECFDEASILVNSTDNVGLETAVRIALYKSQIERGGNPDWDDLQGLRIGREFFRSAKEVCGAAGGVLPKRILRAIVETLNKENMSAVHALKISSHGNDRPRLRGTDGAMRRDIDRNHHLHYWSCSNGIVELASVNFPHDNFWIPE